jgi:hypothetical protein
MEENTESGVEIPADMPAEERLFHQMTDGDFIGEDEEAPQTASKPADEPIEDEEGVELGSDEEELSEDEEEPVEEADPVEPVEFIEYEIEGKLYEIPVELKDHLMKSSDYTQKTQAVAEQRRSLEASAQAIALQEAQYNFAQQIQPDFLQAESLDVRAQELHNYLRENVANLSHSDIEQVRFAIEDAQKQRDQLIEGVKSKQLEFQQASQQSMNELVEKGTEVLKAKFPDWSEKHQERVRDYALNSGFTESEIANVVDPRHVEVLYKASLYDALKDGAAPAVKKVQKAPALVKPSPRGEPMSKETKQKLALRKKLKSNKLNPRQKRNVVAEDLGERWS